MTKTIFQFYATHRELQTLILETLSDDTLTAYCIRFFPEYEVQEVPQSSCPDLEGCTFVIFTEKTRKLDTETDYHTYERETHGDLILHIGKDTESILTESSLGAVSETEINPKWKNRIRTLRKKCLKGASFITHQDRRHFDPKIMYLPGAQNAWKNGRSIHQFTGSLPLELRPETN